MVPRLLRHFSRTWGAGSRQLALMAALNSVRVDSPFVLKTMLYRRPLRTLARQTFFLQQSHRSPSRLDAPCFSQPWPGFSFPRIALQIHDRFRKLLKQSVILAVPGTLISTVLIALIVNSPFGLGYDFNWIEATVLGTMLSATDPVAVVALLKELGAPEELGTLIESESLLNDGVAFALFLVFKDMMMGVKEHTVGSAIGQICSMSIVGVAIGVIMGFLFVYALGSIWNDAVVEVVLAITFAFAVFFVAEAPAIHASGVLAVVCCGVVFSAWSKSTLNAEVAKVMHETWAILGFIANTLVFVYTGVLVPVKIPQRNFSRMNARRCCTATD